VRTWVGDILPVGLYEWRSHIPRNVIDLFTERIDVAVRLGKLADSSLIPTKFITIGFETGNLSLLFAAAQSSSSTSFNAAEQRISKVAVIFME
jgi:hypothetical protein